MTALPPDVLADLNQLVAELEQRLDSSFAAHDAAIARETATAAENARLQHELADARNRETASAEIFQAISEVSGDAQQSLQRILEITASLFNASSVRIRLAEAGEWVKTVYVGRSSESIEAAVSAKQARVGGRNLPGTVVAENRQIHIPDLDDIDPDIADWPGLPPARAAGARVMSGTPLRREGQAIGVLIVHRDQPTPFTQGELALLQSFADQAVIAIENARLFNETREALERQTATADILKVIASSPSDVQPVFEAIAESAKRLAGGHTSTVTRVLGDMVHLAAYTHGSETAERELQGSFPTPLSAAGIHSRVARSGELAFRADMENEPDLTPAMKELARARGYRSILVVPMMREGVSIGTIGVTRRDPGPFSDNIVDLLGTFADQAVIAIENTRLFNETQEALERQTATSEILKVIASSPADAQPVFEAIAHSTKRLLGGFSCAVWRFVEGQVHLAAYTPTTPAADAALRADFPQPVENFEAFGLAQGGKPFPIPDTEEIGHAPLRDIARLHGFRSVTFMPLMNNGVPIGIIAPTRAQPGALAPHHLQLLQTFADQAVIAIENARLFDEVQAKTRDLTEALAYQTGSSNVLRVIASSPTDVDPVLNAIVESARELCEANDAVALLKDGEYLRFSAHSGPIAVTLDKWPIGRGWTAGRAFVDQKPVHVNDMLSAEGAEFPDARRMGQSTGATIHTVLSVPLLRGDESIGAILLRRTEIRPFKDKQIDLLTTFADQAVIAIQNARLFNEVQTRTRDLTEALTYQTGTGNILRVIASSPTDVGPALQAIVESACDLCEANDALVTLRDGDELVFQAQHGSIPIVWTRQPIDREGAAGLAVMDGVPVHVHDLRGPEGDQFPRAREFSRKTNVRTVLCVPLMREGESIGAIVLRRTEVRPFSDKQISLLKTFADQAVIAIGNARLFEQVQQRTRELAASLDELRTAQDRLIQTEKLASLGQLTAGIAHEIKNPLNFVNNFAALSAELTDELNDVLRPAALDDKTRENVGELTGLLKNNLEKVVQHGKRADSIVKNMLLHSREGSGDHRPADVNALIDESLNLAYHGARAEKPDFNVTIKRDFDPAAGSAEVFPQEITRVFLNLVSNGFYAVAKRKFESGEAGYDPQLSAATRNLGDGVEIRIRDNGTGIPPDVKDKMFNPFFTTKPAGEGTGLGLSMSHDIIVKQHGGTIEVETEPGQFTEFRIVLPRTGNPPNKNRGWT